MPDDQTPRERQFQAQTKAQFESLGRFVQAFELMVEVTRTTNSFFLSRGDPKLGQMTNVVLFHSSMTAWPLFEIMRGLYAQAAENYPEFFDQNERSTLNQVMAYCATEYSKLLELRNNLLHGTWRIGWTSAEQQDFSEMLVHKFKGNKSGYALVDLPKTAEELDAETRRCEALKDLLYQIFGACISGMVSGKGSRIRFNVRMETGRWLPEPPEPPP